MEKCELCNINETSYHTCNGDGRSHGHGAIHVHESLRKEGDSYLMYVCKECWSKDREAWNESCKEKWGKDKYTGQPTA